MVHLAPPFRAVVLETSLVIGRGDEADLVADDATMSRAHARISRTEEGLLIEDLGSRNGLLVDGEPTRRTVLPREVPGVTLRAGQTLFRILRGTEDWTAPDADGPLVGGLSLSGIRRQIGLVGPTDLPVLVTGETGTGKEVVARLLHERSGRSGPFIAVNCAALPENLVESELFGHARAAFTGATDARRGLFRAASGGTLFLDEMGELPLALQAKLLRALEEGRIRPVGADRDEKVDVRVVSATNRDLAKAVETGAFRADLLARLASVELRLPALRERPEDVPVLVAHLLSRAGREGAEVSPDALEALLLHDWPMNVRELDNVLRTAALHGDPIALDALPPAFGLRLEQARRRRSPRAAARGPASVSGEFGAEETLPDRPAVLVGGDASPRDEQMRSRLDETLRTCRGNVRETSRALGLSRGHVYRLLRRHRLDPDAYRSA